MISDPLFTLRRASQADLAVIRKLIDIVEINPIGLDWRRFIIAVDVNDQLVGCGQIKPHRDGSLELASIAVQPEWNKQGVASAIILRLLETHPRPVYLVCRSRLRTFYEKFGFVIVTNSVEMPPYFRRLIRLVQVFQRLGLINERLMSIGNLLRLGMSHEHSLVMRCDG